MNNILDLNRKELAEALTGLGEKPFRGTQVFEWLGRGVSSFDEMTNIPASLITKLKEDYYIGLPEVVKKQESKDGTVKCLFRFKDGTEVESVFMNYSYGNSICISSQAGCRMGCTFCASTMDGLERNLTGGEMLGEVLAMRNLTEVSLKNKVLVWYFILVTAIGGIFCYNKLGRMEDPQFTIREMVVSAAWPGATAEEMQEQVTDKLEKKLQDTRGLDHIKSETRAGQTVIYVDLADDVEKSAIREIWHDVRNLCEDEKRELPSGVYGPFYNDRFDDVYGSVYAVTGDGYSYEEMREAAENTRRLLMQVPSVQKVELLGEQEEKVYVEVKTAKLEGLGISPQAVLQALKAQNEMTAAGKLETATDSVYLRVTGTFEDVDDIKALPVSANGRSFRLGDIATVRRTSVDPAQPKMFLNGAPAIGIAVSMQDGGNILQLGEDLKKEIAAAQENLPVGLEIHQVSDQPSVVNHSIHDFVKTLAEAIVIVLAVSFLSLGLRTGLVVAGCIPLVLAGTFVVMYAAGISLHKVSLGSLIIALGLLVDDAIIAVEMMSVQLELGHSRFDAACHAFRATAKPMLTGTLITCAGFIPVAFAKGMASEFCQALFPVIGTALLLSWLVSVMVAPLFGTYLIQAEVVTDASGRPDPYQSRFYQWFRRVLAVFLTHRRIVLAATAVLFLVSCYALRFVKQEFFPASLRPEILVNLELPAGASMAATQAAADRMSDYLAAHMDDIDNYTYYVGRVAPRFVLTVDPKADADNIAQFVVVTKDTAARERLAGALREAFTDEERGRIIRGRIRNTNNYLYETDAGPDTEDSVFLLSMEEAREYYACDEERIAHATPFAKAGAEAAPWRLRSPGYKGGCFNAFVRGDGMINTYGCLNEQHGFGVRPAMWIRL